MALIDYIDGVNRRIYLSVATVGATINPIDIYKEMRILRASIDALRHFDLFMKASGNVPKGSGKFTERYVTLLQGARIVPFDTDHVLTINGTLITDDGFEGIFAFDKLPLSVGTSVDIAYVPPQVEIITIATGSAVTAQDKADIAAQVWTTSQGAKVAVDVDMIRNIEGGKWEIINNQMVFYKADNTTEIARFNLFDNAGNPTQSNVFKRERV